jgi:hypothetical protein
MNRGCIPLTKTPCKDAFKMFLKTKKFNEEQEKFLWKIWRIAWIYGKQYGAIQEEKILTNNGRTNCKPLLTNREMKEIWNNIDPMTGREFGKAIEAYYGIRRRTHDNYLEDEDDRAISGVHGEIFDGEDGPDLHKILRSDSQDAGKGTGSGCQKG